MGLMSRDMKKMDILENVDCGDGRIQICWLLLGSSESPDIPVLQRRESVFSFPLRRNTTIHSRYPY